MEISYISHSCFKIKSKEITLIVDPYNPKSIDQKLPKLESDVVAVTHAHEDHNYIEGVSGYRLIIDGPGEYEVGGVSVLGLDTFHDNSQGSERGKNTIYAFEVDGFNIVHLGDLGHLLSKETLEKLPSVDVLLIPVGGHYTIGPKEAVKVISDLEPSIVIPMHFDTSGKGPMVGVDAFLHEFGAKDVKHESKLKLSNKSDIPEETQVIILDPQV